MLLFRVWFAELHTGKHSEPLANVYPSDTCIMFPKPEKPKLKNRFFRATNPQQTSAALPVCIVKGRGTVSHGLDCSGTLRKEPHSCGKSGDQLISSGVHLGAVEEEMHYLSVQRKWGESGELKFMEIYGSFHRP